MLQALQSSVNNVRSQAEEHLQNNWTNTRPEMLLMGLVEQIMGQKDSAAVGYRVGPQGDTRELANSRRLLGSIFRCSYLPSDIHKDQEDAEFRQHGYVHLFKP